MRRQLTQEYVQKSTMTTLPRSPAAVSGGELSHSTAPSSGGIVPSIGGGNALSFAVATAFGIIALPVSVRVMTDSIESPFFAVSAPIRSTSDCSMRFVLAVETRASQPVSAPSAIATTATRTATPSPRRTHSPAPSERFIAAKSRPPTSSASASDVAEPSAYASSSAKVPTSAPCKAAPVSTSPRIGPAHGAQSRPVPMPSSTDEKADGAASPCSADAEIRAPAETNGCMMRSAKRGSSSVRPNSARIASAT